MTQTGSPGCWRGWGGGGETGPHPCGRAPSLPGPSSARSSAMRPPAENLAQALAPGAQLRPPRSCSLRAPVTMDL